MGRYDGAPSLENVDDIVQRLTDATIIALNENLFSQILYQQTPGDWENATLTAPQQQEINVLDDNEENFPSLGSLGVRQNTNIRKQKENKKENKKS